MTQYKTLADAATVTGDPRYAGLSAYIWYVKPEHGRDLRMGPEFLKEQGIPLPTIKTLDKTHTLLGAVGERNLNEIYRMMQGEVWSPRGEARNLIRKKGLRHTSMSVGDIVQIGNKIHMVDNLGFEKLSQRLARLASVLPKGSPERRKLLAAFQGVRDKS